MAIADSAAIAHSTVLIDSGGSINNPGSNIYGALQLAKNGKIYIAQFGSKKLSVINNPDIPGTGCGLQTDAVDLGTGRSQGGLPAFIQSYLDPHFRVYDYSYSEDCNKQLSFILNTGFAYDSLRWDFDDPLSGTNNTSTIVNPVHAYSTSGLHNVNLFVFNRYGCIDKADTITRPIMVGNKYFNLGNDTTICVKDVLLLNATVNGATGYTWNTSATTPTLMISQPGIYWCDVNFGGCIYRDSLILGNKSYPIADLGPDTTLCEGNTIILDVTNTNAVYVWQDGTVQPTCLVNKKGIYKVAVSMQGCISKDSVIINYQLKPAFTLGEDKMLCQGDSYILKPIITNGIPVQGLSYLWQDGSVNPTYIATRQGSYKLELSNTCGSTSGEIKISKGVCGLYIPNAFTPNGDTKNDIFKACDGDNVISFQMQVFNRYGQLVFESGDKTKGWDGNFNGKAQPQGAYTWNIRYKTLTGQIWQDMQGTVILLR